MITVAEIDNFINNTKNDYFIASTGYMDIAKALEILNTKVDNIIEIGTHNGFSTAILTNWAKHVFTFDISHRNSDYVWNSLGVRNKISCFIGNREELEWEINYIRNNWKDVHLNYEFKRAFIDGNHSYEWIKRDFELVKFTGEVLIHDYNLIPEVRQFGEEIGAIELCYNIGYWKEEN